METVKENRVISFGRIYDGPQKTNNVLSSKSTQLKGVDNEQEKETVQDLCCFHSIKCPQRFLNITGDSDWKMVVNNDEDCHYYRS